MANRLTLWWGGLLALCTLSPGAMAQMVDPTRPPPGILAPTTEAEAVSGPVLQSVLIPRKGKPLAVIGGQEVRLGERYGQSRLIKLTEREAILEGPAGIERLLLTPGVEKTSVATKTVGKDVNRKPALKPAQNEGG